MRHLLLALGLAATACGGTWPGAGTETLFAEVEADGRPDSTKIRVTLTKRGSPVAGANVVIRDVERDLSVNLERKGDKDGARYEGTLNGYARDLELRVTSGEDDLEARLVGPTAHVITRPPNNAIVRRADFTTLDLEWTSDGSADHTRVTVGDLEPIELDGDPGESAVPLGGLKNGAHEVEVRRESSVDLAGGTAGSRMRIRYKVDNRFTLEG